MQKRNKENKNDKYYGNIDLEKMLKDVFGEDCLEETKEEGELGFYAFLEKYKSHKAMKKALGDRVQVLRKLIGVIFSYKKENMTEFEFTSRVEKYLDNLLAKRKYMLNDIISEMQNKVSVYYHINKCKKCGYVKPFCSH